MKTTDTPEAQTTDAALRLVKRRDGHWFWRGGANTFTTDLTVNFQRSAGWRSACVVPRCVNPDHQKAR